MVQSNIQEAREELQELERTIKKSGRRNETQLQISLQHAYHHMNFSWNARQKSDRAYAKLIKQDFEKWGEFPTDIWFE